MARQGRANRRTHSRYEDDLLDDLRRQAFEARVTMSSILAATREEEDRAWLIG